MRICSCYRMVPCALWEVFPELLIFTNLFSTKRDTRKIFVDIALGNLGNHFVVKWLLKSSITKSFLLTYLLPWACLIQCNTVLEQTSRSKNCRHFISNIWTLMYLFILFSMVFCNWFVIECFVYIRVSGFPIY